MQNAQCKVQNVATNAVTASTEGAWQSVNALGELIATSGKALLAMTGEEIKACRQALR